MDQVTATCRGWEWECPHCGCLNEAEILYRRGSDLMCDNCEERVRVHPDQ